jgi:hypothetical protein
MCGADATGGLCEECSTEYVEWACSRCGIRGVRLRSIEGELCWECEGADRMKKLPDSVLAELDRHLEGGRVSLPAVRTLREALRCSLNDAECCAALRLQQLQAIDPERYQPPQSRPPTAESLIAKVRENPQQPLVIEALWDGDTTGWFLVLSCAYDSSDGPVSRDLAVLSFGTDIRHFSGTVPPWPEAKVASSVGPQVADALGVPFYFPSPQEPKDDCPHWWERRRSDS